MATVAEQLRRAREEQNLNVYQVAEITKIKTDHVRALEDGNYQAFSAPVYIRGFVRTYAKILKLDEARIIAALEAELGQTDKFKEPPPLVEKPRTIIDFVMLQLSRLKWRTVVVAGLVGMLLLISITVFRNWKGKKKDPLSGLGPGLYQPRNGQSGETLPLPGSTPPAR
jgi:cytoskeleton protein RodZ